MERLAFGHEKEAELVKYLLSDPSAKLILSLLAFKGDRPVGHISFTTAHLKNRQNKTAIAILAPLAIVPDAQKQSFKLLAIAKHIFWEITASYTVASL